MGLFGVVVAFGPAIGPTIAGIIIDQANWHIMFWIISALSIVVLLASLFTIAKEAPLGGGNVTLDTLSVFLSTMGFGAVLYGLSTIGSAGINVLNSFITILGIVALVFFFRRQLRMENPMLRVQVLKNPTFLIGTIIGMLVQAALLAVNILVPVYIQSFLGLSATISGLIIMPGAIVMAIMGPIAGRLFDRYGARSLSIVGTGILAATSFVFVFFSLETSMVFLMCLYTVRLFSLALVNMPITTWAMNALDDKILNHGTSVNNTLRQVAGSLGTAIVISVYSSLASARSLELGWTQAHIFGLDIAFLVTALLCLIAFIMVLVLVKDNSRDARATDLDKTHKSLLETIMKRDVFSIPENATVASAVHLFVEKGISAAPIVNSNNEAVGFISDGDIMRSLSRRDRSYMDPVVMIIRTESDNHGFDEKLDALMKLNVKRIGVSSLVSVDVHASLAEVCRVLGEHRLKKVPVLDNGRLVGMINRSDITQYAMRMYLERN